MSTLFSIINNEGQFSTPFIEEQFSKGVRKIHIHGEDNSDYSGKTSNMGQKMIIGIGENTQVIVINDVVLSCNGTIYNAHELFKYMNITPVTDLNYEIIIHLYIKYGMDHMLQMLDGDFVFFLVDNRMHLDSFKMYVARDPYGLKPMYILYPNKYDDKHIIGLATEMKMLHGFYHEYDDISQKDTPVKNNTLKNETMKTTYKLVQFPPGTYSSYFLPSKVMSKWTLDKEFYRYHTMGYNSLMYHTSPQYENTEIVLNIQRYLIRSVEKRCSSTDQPMGCLLSGGLDSSIIAGLVKQYHVTHKLGNFETFTVGMEGSEDLKYGKMMAEHLGSIHHELVLKKEDIFKAIPEVVQTIETYDTNTVRTSIAHYLLGKYISENAKAKIIFNGDGADEVFGGHLYMYLADESVEFDCEVRRLLKNIHHFDVLRTEKCVSCHGLQSISPFLDRAFVQYYLSVAPQVRFHTRNEQCEKFFLRLAFNNKNYRDSIGKKIMPEENLWRTTESFCDGMSPTTNSLHEMLQNYTNDRFIRENIRLIPEFSKYQHIYREVSLQDPILNNMKGYLVPDNVEQYIYRKAFERHYPGAGEVLPYFWLPRYSEKIYDPSPRSLKIYGGEEPEESDKDSDEDSDEEFIEETGINRFINNFTLTPPDNFNGDFSQPIKVCVNIITSEGTSKIAEFTPNFCENVVDEKTGRVYNTLKLVKTFPESPVQGTEQGTAEPLGTEQENTNTKKTKKEPAPKKEKAPKKEPAPKKEKTPKKEPAPKK